MAKEVVKPEVKIPVDLEIIQHVVNYCEEQAIYDKLGRYGDFYYKLKALIGNQAK